MVMRKETILTQGYPLPLNDLQLFDVSRFCTVPYSWAYWSLGLSRVKYSNNKLSRV